MVCNCLSDTDVFVCLSYKGYYPGLYLNKSTTPSTGSFLFTCRDILHYKQRNRFHGICQSALVHNNIDLLSNIWGLCQAFVKNISDGRSSSHYTKYQLCLSAIPPKLPGVWTCSHNNTDGQAALIPERDASPAFSCYAQVNHVEMTQHMNIQKYTKYHILKCHLKVVYFIYAKLIWCNKNKDT